MLLAFAIPSGSRVNLDNFFDWSNKRLRMANSFYEGDETPLVAQKDYITTVSSLSKISKQAVPPATRLEHKLYPWVYFLILPLFALTNADVAVTGLDFATVTSLPVVLGVFCGLVLGKPIGIMLFSFITVKTKIASLPEFVTWRHMLGASVLGGVGFTMAIFVANLAYADALLITEAKLSILVASTVAGVIGFVLLLLQAKADQRRGISYVTIVPDDGNVTHADAEMARDSEELVDQLGDEELAERVRAASEHAAAPGEIKVEIKGE